MLIIDIYTIPNTLKNKKSLAKLVARIVKNVKKDKTHGNVLCLIHETDALSNDNGEDNYIHTHIIHGSGRLIALNSQKYLKNSHIYFQDFLSKPIEYLSLLAKQHPLILVVFGKAIDLHYPQYARFKLLKNELGLMPSST
ncbi:hypothetical protein [Lactococcus allomyrinae]|uniref:Uncharacterized protein n=1 Tax=Lactococcus allomyrinae TaxID=2419773 RepID=A0A387BH12_9LACT|nr:hypothetical protein [Lactococcus allomyrinae]AYG00416.1 hypothetical protein D7I46_04510 [Lactococcus allomyrinae]